MSSLTNGFSQGTVLQVAYSVLTLTSCVVLARTGLGFLRPRPLTASDAFVIFAFACYATMCALYMSLSPLMQRLYDVANHKSPPYPEQGAENTRMTKMLFAAFCLFWMTLWSIKFSLLFLYRKLLVGLAKRYTIIWWVIAGICIVTHAGNYVLYIRSCGGHISGFWGGKCEGKASKQAQLVSLYYSFSVDTITNIMVMGLPIKLTWNLKMVRNKKIAIRVLFASGVVCIMFAALRVAQVAINAAKPGAGDQPLDPTWLAIWGMVECSIAIIIGCCPSFAVLVNAFRSEVAYDSQGYRKYSRSFKAQSGSKPIQLRIRERNHQIGLDTTDLHWADAHSSQEQLRTTHDGILVSETIKVESRESCRETPASPHDIPRTLVVVSQ